MDESLIQLVTELVMAELHRSQGSSAPPASDGEAGRKLLLVPAAPGVTSADPIWAALRGIAGVAWTAVRVPGVCAQKLEAALGRLRWVDPPAVWDELVHAHQAVVLPVLRVDTVARVANLLCDAPVSAAAVAAVMQGVPLYAGATEVDRLRRASGRLPGPFLSVLQQHLRTAEGMGLQVLEAEVLAQRLGRSGPAAVVPAASKGRDVVTVADLEAAARAGQKILQVVPGTIITPLAQEKAQQMQIEVRFS